MRKLKQRTMSLFLALITFISFIPAFPLEVFASAGQVHLYADTAAGKSQLLVWAQNPNASYLSPYMIFHDEGGNRIPSYCYNPRIKGIDEHASKAYDVDLVLSGEPHLWGVIRNGWPAKTPIEMGLQTEYEAYTVTKFAVWAVVDPGRYGNMNDWSANGSHNEHVLTAFKNLVEKAKQNTETATGVISITPKTTMAIDDPIDPTKLSQEFVVDCDIEINGYYVALNNAPGDAQITDLNNTPKTSFSGGENFKVLLDKTGTDRAGNFDISIGTTDNPVTNGASVIVYEGVPTVDPSSWQPYVVSQFNIHLTGAGTGAYVEQPEDITTGELTLQIYKRADGTNFGLAGATFRVTDSRGDVIATVTTDSTGQVTVPLPHEGIFYVEELSAPQGYQISASSHQHIEVHKDIPAKLTFYNKEFTKLKIYKVDADTGAKLPGATIRIALDGGNEYTDVITGANGEATITIEKDGTYKISEIVSPEGYLLNENPVYVKIEAGMGEVSATITNKKKPGIIIRKYDEDTGAELELAEFSIAKKGGSIVHEGMTNMQGELHVTGLEGDQWYTITEIAPPPGGYIIATESKDVYLPAGETVEIKFDNRRRPSLQIFKLDQDGNPLEGAIFHVRKTEAETTSEYVSDEFGRILIENLDEAVYSIFEYKEPEGYVKTQGHQDILTEWGKTKTVYFTNIIKPKLEILKIDSVTKEPIPNTKYRITRVEDETIIEELTDSSGRIYLEGLEEGIYKIEETIANDDYILSAEPAKEIKLSAGDEKQLIYENIRKPIFILTKTNALTNKGVPNTRFSIKREKGDGSITNLGTFVTDKNGQIIIPKAQVGWYICEETVPAPGMSLPKDPVFRFYLAAGENAYSNDDTSTGKEQEGNLADYNDGSVKITYGEDYILGNEIIDYPLNSLVVKKVSSVDLSMLGGAVFELRRVSEDVTGSSGALIARFTTPASGIAVITGLEPGGFIVEEVSPPKGFTLSENSQQQIWIKYDNTSIAEITFTNTPYGNLLITKANQLNQPLSNARFTVTEADGTLIGTQNDYVTDADGKILIEGIKPGTSVVISEKEAPPYHTLSGTPQTVQIGYEGKTHTVHFVNDGYANLLISKVNQLNQPLASARFKVTQADGTVIGNSNGEYVSDINGEILIENIPIGTSVHITELEAPPNHTLSTESQIVEIRSPGETHTVRFVNQGYGHLLISKVNQDNQPLRGARFKVTTAEGTVLGNGNGEYISDINGEILIENIPIGTSVVATELEAPPNHQLITTPQTMEITKPGEIHTLRFVNEAYGGLIIRKFSSEDNSPLANAVFSVKRINGEVIGNSNGIFTTNNFGVIEIPNIYGDLEIVEIQAPENYHLEQQTKTIRIEPNTIHTEDFWNAPYGNLLIRKFTTDGQPLANATFLVTDDKGTIWGNNNGLYSTDQSGQVLIENVFGTLIIKEEKAPDHYILDNQSQTIKIEAGRTHTADFYNRRKSGVTIWKFDENRQPLAGSVYKLVKLPTNEEIGTYTIPPEGFVTIDDLSPGVYSCYEVSSPSTHVLDSTPKQFEITGDEHIVLEFFNQLKSSIIIQKKDEQDGTPLSSVLFEVRTQNGTFITEVESDESGTATIPSLEPGFYVLKELRQKEGYAEDNESRVVEVKANTPTVVQWTNRKLGGLTVSKLNSVTRQPISNVEFQLSYMNGERIGTFKTGNDGQFHVPHLESGWYTLVETWVDEDQYVLDVSPINFEIVSGNEPKFIEVLNDPLPILTVIKTDQDGNPLQGVLFEVRKENGELIGTTYKTDHRGRFEISDDSLSDGKVYIYELEALPGYKKLTEPVEAIIRKGKSTVVRIVNEELGGLRLLKIDSVTEQPIYNVEFRVYDFETNKEVGGPYYTDDQGIIDFSGILPEGRYKIVETRPAEGYLPDPNPRTIEFRSGQITEVVWRNTPNMGQIQILKLSAEDNEVNGLPKGTPLADAVFEVYNYRTGNVLDQFKTGSNGIGVSKPLPVGRYKIREVSAPKYYKISDVELDVEIEFPNQILKFEFTNEAANTGVQIRKTGPQEVLQGQQIKYDIVQVQNTSTVPLTDFFVRDIIPADAVRLDTIVTGSYNQSLKYKIMYKTNRNDYRVMADNLSTTQNNVIDARPAALGMFSDEYITEIMFVFGNVKAGFCQVEHPYLLATVNTGLPDAYQFANRADLGGQYGLEWIIGNSTCVTTVYNPAGGKMPKTGW